MRTRYLLLPVLAAALCASASVPVPARKAAPASAPDRQAYSIYVDKEGVMRRSDTKQEVSYYGTNYTVPFAHAYRALGRLGVDRKEAIRRDVYHMARLGLNAFRLHLWDVELTDADGTDGTYIATVPVKSLRPSLTWLLPAAYPSFMARSYAGTPSAGLHPRHPEFAVITLPALAKDHPVNLTLRALLLYKKH